MVTIHRDMEDTSNIWSLMLKLYEVMPEMKEKEAELLPIIKKSIHLNKLSIYSRMHLFFCKMKMKDLEEFLNEKIETHNNWSNIDMCKEWYKSMTKDKEMLDIDPAFEVTFKKNMKEILA